MIRSLAEEDAESLLAVIEDLVAQSRDLETVLTNLAEILHRITLVQCVPGYRDADRSDWPAIESLAELIPVEDAQLFYQIAIKGRSELGLAPDPRTGLEMTLLRMLAFRPASAGQGAATPVSGAAPKSRKPATGNRQDRPRPVVDPPREAVRRVTEPEADDPVEPELFSSPCSMPKVEPVAAGRAVVPEPPPVSMDSSDRTEEENWLVLQKHLEISGQVRELARNIQLQSREKDQWQFLISPSLRYMGSATVLTRLGEAISTKMGHPVRIKLLDSENQDLVSVAALDEQKALRTMSEAEKAIEEDPTVKALKEQLGARIVEDSIQPLQ
jgi:DNA polymerase-3 subunit gamma/tau